jgi:hypothetical protein
MPSKHKNQKKIKQSNIKITEKKTKNIKESDIYESDSDSDSNTHLKNKNIGKKFIPVTNSYPFANLGYGYPNPAYSIQVNKKPDDNKYFHNYKYTYNVQVNKPVLTYNNFITQRKLNNITPQEHKYYQQFQQQSYNFNGHYEVANHKPTVLALQANLGFPMYSGGPAVGETNGQIGYTPQPTQSTQSINPNSLIGLNSGNVQVYKNSPAYTGVQAKTLPGQNLIANMNAEQTKANNANINNPAYFNYNQYYY